MAKVNLTQALAGEYRELFQTMEIDPDRFDVVDGIADRILANKARYEAAAGTVGAPWYFVAAIHKMESSLRMDRHLHNGDSLMRRTTHVPPGRPVEGDPPITWEESALDPPPTE